jgi:hypothetical protein
LLGYHSDRSPVLTKLHLYGAPVGISPAPVPKSLGRGPLWVGAPIALGDLGPYFYFGVPAQLNEIRDLCFGPDGERKLRRALARWIEVPAPASLVLGSRSRP